MMDGQFGKLAFDHRPQETTPPRPPRPTPLPDNAGDNVMPLEPLVILGPVVPLVRDSFCGPTADQMGHLRPVGFMARGDMHSRDDFTRGILRHVELVAVETFGRCLAPKAGIRIGGVAVNVGLVRIVVLVLILEPEDIERRSDVSAVESMKVLASELML